MVRFLSSISGFGIRCVCLSCRGVLLALVLLEAESRRGSKIFYVRNVIPYGEGWGFEDGMHRRKKREKAL